MSYQLLRRLGSLGGAVLLAGLIVRSAASVQTSAPGAEMDRTTFDVRVENVSTDKTLKLSTGGTAPAPTSPLVWLVHSTADPLFDVGKPDRGQGLEELAEWGSPATLSVSLEGRPGVYSVGTETVPAGEKEAGPLLPGGVFRFTVQAEPAQRLTVAMMFGQSNDLFLAPDGRGIPLFDADDRPTSGDFTGRLILWDAGTEVNQEPGVGADQGPRQASMQAGTPERGTVRPVYEVRDGFTYPRVERTVKLTITPRR